LTLFESIILGLIQGLSEFLPISSSGHLALLQYFFGIEGESVLAFAVLLHLGTLLSIFAVYYKDIWDLIRELFATLADLFTGRGLRINANETRRLGFMIIVATIPTGIIGVLFNDLFESMYLSLAAIGTGLLITGTLLWFSEKIGKGRKNVLNMKFRDAFLVGLFQSVAITPGISRSGSTIVGGLFSGMKREIAVRFAFLISIPSVLGAVVMEAPSAFKSGMDMSMLTPIIIGVAIAAVSGFIAIKTMIRIVSNKKLYYFSFYTWAVGAIVLIYTFLS